MAKLDDTGFDTVVFDESYLSDLQVAARSSSQARLARWCQGG